MEAEKAFLVNCSDSLILDHGCSTLPNEKPSDLQKVLLVNLSSLLLKNLEQLGRCKALKICILADNFLTRIDHLVECVHLVKLDLKGNQITQLPSALFWSSLNDLQLLNLHDNNIADRKSITPLSSCLNLTALTLYNTPLSLKHNYRHCVVNSILSLKALDNCVISDEEIVENWHLPSKYKRMDSHFCINLYPSSKTNSYKTEMKVVQEIIATVNRIQANHCPILIIQKWIRGHLTRRCLGLCKTPKPLRVLQRQVTPAITQLHPHSSETTSSWIKECKTDQQIGLKPEKKDSVVTRLYIHLSKLVQADSQEEMISTRSFDSKKLENLRMPCNTPIQSDDRNPCDGKLNIAISDNVHDVGMEFHLSGFKATMHSSEPFVHMLISRKTAGQEVREAIDHFHSQKHCHSYSPKPRLPKITAEKQLIRRTIDRCNDGFSLAPFRVIERAYWEKEKAKDLKEKVERVAKLQGCRDEARGHHDNFMETWRMEALLQQDKDKAEMEKAFRLQRAKIEQELHLARKKHLSFLEEKRRRVVEQEMVTHFSGQHSALAKAMIRQCIKLRVSNAQREKRRQVAVNKEHTDSQKLLIQQYMENRKQKIHAEAIASRASMHNSLSEKQHYELLKAQARVAHIKSSHYEVEVLRPVPHNQHV